jgi:hypothetical protein
MGKRLSGICLFGLLLASSPFAWGNNFYYRSPQFTLPQGDIAFMGFYWSPLTIDKKDGAFSAEAPPMPGQNVNVVHSGNFSVGLDTSKMADLFAGPDTAPPTTPEALGFANQAVLEKGTGMGLPITAVNYSVPYQNAVLMHVLNPAKWRYNPQITRYCGNKPYLLIGIIDYCGIFQGPAKIREKENDKPIQYFGKRSILEQDTDIFANKKSLHSVALEFFLISTVDGTTLWQGNVMNTAQSGNNYEDLVRGLTENALKDMAKK